MLTTRLRWSHEAVMSVQPPVLLPLTLSSALDAVAERLDQQRPIEAELAARLAELQLLPPISVVRAEAEIVHSARLFHWRRKPPAARLFRWIRTTPDAARTFAGRLSDLHQLSRVDGLEYVFLFHRDGYIREAALEKITGALPSAFAFAAICRRLNDWAEPVRHAAMACANRTFPETSAAIVAAAALDLLTRESSWGRWREERHVFEDSLRRTDVNGALSKAIIRRQRGPTATAMRFALRSDGLDHFLPEIARDAVQPEVRALAARTLIDGFASWPNGWQWRWIDKSMGVRRREKRLDRRDLSVTRCLESAVAAAAADKAAIVRKIALAGLIRYAPGSTQAQSIAASLAGDPARSVRVRAAFILRNRADAG